MAYDARGLGFNEGAFLAAEVATQGIGRSHWSGQRGTLGSGITIMSIHPTAGPMAGRVQP
jgi:hypothetical protein